MFPTAGYTFLPYLSHEVIDCAVYFLQSRFANWLIREPTSRTDSESPTTLNRHGNGKKNDVSSTGSIFAPIRKIYTHFTKNGHFMRYSIKKYLFFSIYSHLLYYIILIVRPRLFGFTLLGSFFRLCATCDILLIMLLFQKPF